MLANPDKSRAHRRAVSQLLKRLFSALKDGKPAGARLLEERDHSLRRCDKS